MTETGKKTLYICYFGVREPLVQTQVLPYLRELLNDGIEVSLLTFEPLPWAGAEASEHRQELQETGIDWHSLPYHKRFSAAATSYDILNGAKFIRGFARNRNVDVLHARSHIPLSMALVANRSLHLPLIFDLRGLMAEEYVDSGIWKEGSAPFRAVKWIEKRGLRDANQIVVLTEKMKSYLADNNLRAEQSVNVIPCCVDLSRLDARSAAKRERFELIYAGSVTGLYMLEEMGVFFKVLRGRRPDAFFRILTASDPEFVYGTFRRLGINENDYEASRAAPADVLNIVSRGHLAISFRKPTFSQIAASPTKIPEYLACGLPVVVNDGVGDTTEFTEADGVGAVIREFSPEAYLRAIDHLEALMEESEALQDRCIKSAHARFDLETVGGVRYRRIYQRLLQF